MKALLLHELFEARAMQQPAAIAIKTPCKKITYSELITLTYSLAQQLVVNHVEKKQLIAVVMEKGWEQVVATLGILKSGSAYLPVDPEESKERLHYLIQIAEVNIILTQKKYKDIIDWPKEKLIIEVDSLKLPLQSSFELLSNLTSPSPDDLAYVIFTSGSTGVPKGVMISHKSAVNTILDINKRFDVTENDKVFALSNLNFDLSVYDIFGLLAAGGTVVIPTAEQVKNPIQWKEIFFKEEISIWNSAPALMDIFIECLQFKIKNFDKHALRLVLLSGDWISLNLPKKIRSLFGSIQIISLGGATEASIWSILYSIRDIDPTWKSIPYGKAMKNQAFYILDDKLEPVKNNDPGELFIGGVGIAKGYWRDEERTNAQFILHPIFGVIYKTGDLGRYLPDGNIEFLGRIDFQVKIAGYRVEINAIEKYLLDFPSINKALVLAVKEGNHQKLVAYINFNYDRLRQQGEEFNLIEIEQVDYWKKVYDEIILSNNSTDSADSTFNTSGWTNSYLNVPIPKIQMLEWVENTVKRIKFLQPKSVLEIGCGTGLLLFRLAEITKQYDATDISKSAIDYVGSQLGRLGIDNVELIECEANKIKDLEKTYDVVLLNSVIQYFPSMDYFIDVLNQCVNKIKDKGSIFIGDIRNFNLLKEFHASILLKKEVKHLTCNEWLDLLEKCIEEEDELTIDPNFFYAYQAKNEQISHVEILLKEGRFHNEMNCYRYDVILYINQPAENINGDIFWKDWNEECDDCSKIEAIHSAISQNSFELFAIKNIPNKRTVDFTNLLIADGRFSQLENWYEATFDDLAKKRAKAIDPQMFFEIASEHGYYASIAWSKVNPSENFDVIFVKKHYDVMPKTYLTFLRREIINLKDVGGWNCYSNLPLLPRINRSWILEVKKFLQARLPQYMIPNYFVPVNELPITANGKVDRQTLSFITHLLPKTGYIKPYTDTQKKLTEIWQEILGMQNIGIRHNFYDLGGTSLLVIQLIINICNKFGIDLNLQELEACKFNIEYLSLLIEKKLNFK